MLPRVLFLMPNFGVGGAERSLLMIAAHAKQGGFEPVVGSLGPPRRPEFETVLADIRALGVEVHDLGVKGRADRSPRSLLEAVQRLRRFCRTHRIDVVDSCLFEADVASRLAVIGLRTKQVTHLVNVTYADEARSALPDRSRWKFEAVRMIDALTGRLSSFHIPITQAVADSAAHALGLRPTRVRVIPRGVRLDEFVPATLVRAPADNLKVVAVGRLVPQKDHRTAIAALAHLRASSLPVSLDIYGEGALETVLNEQIRASSLAGVARLQPPTRDVPAVLNAHHVFCFPSLHEGLGNALIEAMACARPVVVSDIPVLREVAGEHGVYFPPGDAKALADRLADIATWPVERLQHVGMALRARAEAEYAAPLQAERLGALYRELLGR